MTHQSGDGISKDVVKIMHGVAKAFFMLRNRGYFNLDIAKNFPGQSHGFGIVSSGGQIDSLKKRGYQASSSGSPDFRLTWSPVAKSEEAVFGHLLYALIHKFKMSVYYCSCRTQDWIAENALKNARASA